MWRCKEGGERGEGKGEGKDFHRIVEEIDSQIMQNVEYGWISNVSSDFILYSISIPFDILG